MDSDTAADPSPQAGDGAPHSPDGRATSRGSFRYFAFISYSRKDIAAAKWLQSRLEWFRFPVRLVPADARPDHASYIRPIYRDRTNLEVDKAHYWENLRGALEQSRYLIVLCSPDAATSRPVDAEVRHFLESHGNNIENVVPVILRGRVSAAGEEAALCPALAELGEGVTGRNLPSMIPDLGAPLKEGWESGFISLVGYLLQVPINALSDHIRREESRLAFRSRVLALLFAVIAIIAVCSGIIAWQKQKLANAERDAKEFARQQEAREHQRAEEALIKARQTLSHSDSIQARTQLNDGAKQNALAYLARSLRSDPGNKIAAARLVCLLTVESMAIPRKTYASVRAAVDPVTGQRLEVLPDAKICLHDAQGTLTTLDFSDRGGVLSARFMARGRRVIVWANDWSVTIWDTQTRQLLLGPLARELVLSSPVMSEDGKLFGAVSKSEARVWDLDAKALRYPPLALDRFAESIAFSPDAKLIATASWTNADEGASLRLWDAATGQPVTPRLVYGSWLSQATFSPDGKQIIAASDQPAVPLWEVATGKMTTPFALAKHATVARFSPDGTRVVAGDDTGACVWDLASGKALTPVLPHPLPVREAKFSQDGRCLLTYAEDGYLHVWNSATGAALVDPIKVNGGIADASFEPDGRRIMVQQKDHTTQVWEIHLPGSRNKALMHQKVVFCSEFDAKGAKIVTGSFDHTARIWDAKTHEPLTAAMAHGDNVYDVHFDTTGRYVATASGDRTARLWNAETGEAVSPPLAHAAEVHHCEFSHDGHRLLTACDDGSVSIWEVPSGRRAVGPIEFGKMTEGGACWAAFSPDDRSFLMVVSGHKARLCESVTGKSLQELETDVFAEQSAFSPDGKAVLVCGAITTQLWETATGKPIGKPLYNDRQGAWGVRFSPDGERFATISADHTARLYDARTATPIGEVMQHPTRVDSLDFSPDGEFLATGCGNGELRIWSGRTGEFIASARFYQRVFSVRFRPDGTQVLVADQSFYARTWDFKPKGPAPKWLPDLAEAIANQSLNERSVFAVPAEAPDKVFQRLITEFDGVDSADSWSHWAAWVLADRGSRTLSPFGNVGIRDRIEENIKTNTLQSLAAAEFLAWGDTATIERISRAKNSLSKNAAETLAK